MTRMVRLLATSGTIGLAALAAAPAFAAGTAAGSSVVNNVTVNYTVGGVAQTAVNASNTLLVDRRVTISITEPGNATTSVAPGSTNQVTTFQVTNTSNAALDLGLSVAQGTAAHGGTDNFDVTAPTIWINTGPSVGSATYDPANSVQVTYLDELAADTSRFVFVLANVPAGRVTGDVSGLVLTAQARDGGTAGVQGSIVTQTTGANTAGLDTVFSDGAGATDAARDGQFSARDDYTVAAANISVIKTSTVISDPLNGTTNPKMIPGAVVAYCIQVANAAGGAAANAVSISDPVPTQTTYDAGYGIFLNGTVTGGVCNPDGTAGGTFTAGTVSGTIASVAAAQTRTLYFRVTLN